ncbi:MAG: hypothetical protein WKG01_08945 [Kofleriaceae bacterium]
MKPTINRIVIVLLSLLALSQVGATDCGGVIKDPGFDLWCGEALCSWKVVRGDARRSATWHSADAGVELLGTDSAIQQLTPVNSTDGLCIRFDLVANVEEGAEVALEIDVYGDGSVERSERIPTSNWKPLSYRLRFAAPYDGIRFQLSKRGTGKAVLAQIEAELADDCAGLTEISGTPAPLGARCEDDVDCASALCVGKVCAGCDPEGAACSPGNVCGVGDALSSNLAVPLECMPEGARQTGEQCVSNTECASAICTPVFSSGVCSACDASTSCGGACGPAWTTGELFVRPGPAVCRPGAGVGARGAACGTSADCASGSCQGPEHKQCADGRACLTRDDCPVRDDLVPGECTTVGIEGGSCS